MRDPSLIIRRLRRMALLKMHEKARPQQESVGPQEYVHGLDPEDQDPRKGVLEGP